MYRFYPLYEAMIKETGTHRVLTEYTHGVLGKYTHEELAKLTSRKDF